MTVPTYTAGYGGYGVDTETLSLLQQSLLQLTLEQNFEGKLKNPEWEQVFQRTQIAQENFPIKAPESLPSMKRFISQRKHQVMRGLQGSCRSYKYEITMDVDKDALRYQGQFRLALIQARSMAWKHAKFIEDRAFNFLAGCDGITGMDGANVCAATHHSSATNKNLFTSENFSRANYETTKQAMRLFQDASGDTWGSEPNILVIHPNSIEDAKRLLASPLLIGYGGGTNTEDGNVNVYHNDVGIVISNVQLSAGQFFLLDTRDGDKPFIFNEPFGGPEWDKKGNPSTEFERDIYTHGGLYHFGMGATEKWHKILGSYNGSFPTYTDPATEAE